MYGGTGKLATFVRKPIAAKLLKRGQCPPVPPPSTWHTGLPWKSGLWWVSRSRMSVCVWVRCVFRNTQTPVVFQSSHTSLCFGLTSYIDWLTIYRDYIRTVGVRGLDRKIGVITAKMEVIRGRQACHNFWGRSVGYWHPGRTAILRPPKVVRCLTSPARPHFAVLTTIFPIITPSFAAIIPISPFSWLPHHYANRAVAVLG